MCDNFNFDYYIFILKVKQRFAQVIIAMAHHDYLSLEGGNLMIEFIIRQCSLQKEMQVTFPPIISLTVVMFLLFSLILYKKNMYFNSNTFMCDFINHCLPYVPMMLSGSFLIDFVVFTLEKQIASEVLIKILFNNIRMEGNSVNVYY